MASIKRAEVSDPKVLPRSEKLVTDKGPRVAAIMDKGREYERKRTERTEKQAAKEKAECTFRPKVLSKPSQKRGGEPVHDMLYKTGLSKYAQRIPKARDELEYERAKGECTFKPSISVDSQAYSSVGSKRPAKAKAVIDRPESANVKKGGPLIVDINYGKGKKPERIMLFEGEDPSPIVDAIASQLGLEQREKSTLLGAIQQETALPRIDEEPY